MEVGQAGPDNSSISSELSATWKTLFPQLQILFSRGGFMSLFLKLFLTTSPPTLPLAAEVFSC